VKYTLDRHATLNGVAAQPPLRADVCEAVHKAA